MEPVTIPAAYEVVADRLRRLIHLGVYAEGERLPSERALINQLGVSRTTVREAIRGLQATGYLGVRRGSTGGAYVMPQGTPPHHAPARLRERVDDFHEIVEFRIAIEGMVARLAAERRSRQDCVSLRNAIERMRTATKMAEFRRGDNAFHMALAEAAGNAHLKRAVEDARAAWFAPLESMRYELLVDESVAAHERILVAVEARGPDVAMQAAHDHIRQAEREFLDAIEAPGARRPQARSH